MPVQCYYTTSSFVKSPYGFYPLCTLHCSLSACNVCPIRSGTCAFASCYTLYLATTWNTWLGEASQGFWMVCISLCIPCPEHWYHHLGKQYDKQSGNIPYSSKFSRHKNFVKHSKFTKFLIFVLKISWSLQSFVRYGEALLWLWYHA